MTRRAWEAFTRTQLSAELRERAWVIGFLAAALLCFAVNVTSGIAR